MKKSTPNRSIRIRGARQNNLKAIDLDLPLNELIVVTGVSGSGKSSLAFDTIYSEGQRRYVETFSPYARQFLDRMDKPRTDKIEGIPPAIAIQQNNPVRTSRSTVGTMTELNDHLKLLFAGAAHLECESCGKLVKRDTPESIYQALRKRLSSSKENPPRVAITFPITIPANFKEEEVLERLAQQGYHRIHRRDGAVLHVVQDRVRFGSGKKSRIVEDLEAALKFGQGKVSAFVAEDARDEEELKFSNDLHCAHCDIHYKDPTPNAFSFNSPLGACETCRGFGRVIGVDHDLVIPNKSKSPAEGAIKPFESSSYLECKVDLLRFAKSRKIPMNTPWAKMPESHRSWVLDGEGEWEDGKWYGVRGFFDWLEKKSYKMHIRVLLSRYRSYHECPACNGARLRPASLLWRIGPGAGLNIHEVMKKPVDECLRWFENLTLPTPLDEATKLVLDEIRTRLGYLVEVGLGYLTLDRQSRTLSGGEVQRINLTTALGTSLVGALFVLDEPSIGLHSRDINRLIGILHRLRDAGNTLLVVEHDPEVIRAADRVIDMGPGPGEHGGEIVFNGSIPALLRSRTSVTADYLSGRKKVYLQSEENASGFSRDNDAGILEVRGACEHNLCDIDVAFPLGKLVCVTGVSGSGKSTLVRDVMYRALCRILGKPTEQPGKHRDVSGSEGIADVVLVDQSPIGKTTRSNPASYVGALGKIRELFAFEPLARKRKYTAGTFSFNSGNGRCPTCSGNGFQHVEMQFLSDVYLRCPDCDGARFRKEILDVKLFRRASIAEVLDMTVTEACDFFRYEPTVIRQLEPLRAVGLDYMKLGQPVPTLSGGEAQRLKLAGQLVATKKSPSPHTLFLFDEPTTGLHFSDIATLLGALRRLVERGNSVILIEHNLDVIAASDWIIDLGPEGGGAGGRVTGVGEPEMFAEKKLGYTGRALASYLRSGSAGTGVAEAAPAYAVRKPQSRPLRDIQIHNAREHNLQNVSIRIPRDKFTVVTGISGSGKSTVAFDILFSEGRRRYLESLNAYARQFVQLAARPDVDAIFGIPPTVAIEQRVSRGGRKSTVSTVTEIYHFLRLLFVKLGVQYCPDCHIPIEPRSREEIFAEILRGYRNKKITILSPRVIGRKGYYTDLAEWARGKGFSHLRVDGKLVSTDAWPRLDRYKEHNIEIPVAQLTVSPSREHELEAAMDHALDLGDGVVYVSCRGRDEKVYSTLRSCRSCGRSFEEPDPRMFSYNSKHGWCNQCFGTGLQMHGFDEEQTGEEVWWNAWWDGDETVCSSCEGKRLRPEALAIRYRDHSIADYTAMSVDQAQDFFNGLRLKGREAEIARDIRAELASRLSFLGDVGLSYLTLDRAAPTLSGGEAQRIRLASQLGSNLRGVCYVLDEPTIGLHSRDNRMLLDTLKKLEKKGNTVVVVEHDEDTIRSAEYIVDLGPGAGKLGGKVLAQGTLKSLLRSRESVTGRFLRNPLQHPIAPPGEHFVSTGKEIIIRSADLHNLKGIDATVPLERLVCVTGVSGSGKSTLVRNILHDGLRERLAKKKGKGGSKNKSAGYEGIDGYQLVGRVLEVDQTPIGRTPRSCPATYVGFWDNIRKLFAQTAEAAIRGYTPSRFSFNVRGGRCDACEGQGVKRIEMSFLPDVPVTCEECGGIRFNDETLSVRFKGKSIGKVLQMNVDEALEFFEAHSSIRHALALLQDVGLGYLTLGQQSPTLSGGEAQRIKLVTELAKVGSGRPGRGAGTKQAGTLYVLDEPTIGLHMADVEKLIRVLRRLVDAGNTVVVIEHNLDIVAEADWILDLGPEGGDAGGQIVAEGPPAELVKAYETSHTARFLREFLSQRKAG